jgi:hypothetical protein
MPSSGLSGPYSLTTREVSRIVSKVSAGAYALGSTKDGVFHIYYVGRSDGDVAKRLQQHVIEWYPQFKFNFFPSAKSAFDKECNLYHDFNPSDNKAHPARPANTNWKCQICDLFD